ncbi:MAG: glyceraldehyde-3-phosphate dehydrogenase [Bacteroidota bacterium]
MDNNKSFEKELGFKAHMRKATVEFIKMVSDLWYDRAISIVLFKHEVIDKNVSTILNLHQYAGEFVQKPISIFDAVEILRAIADLKLPPSKIDIGKLTYEFHSETNGHDHIKTFIQDKLKEAHKSKATHPKYIVLYGFEQISQLLTRELTRNAGLSNQLRLRAIVTNDRTDFSSLANRALQLRTTPPYGQFNGTITIDEKKQALIINGVTVYFINTKEPHEVDYTRYDISEALVVDTRDKVTPKKSIAAPLKAKGIAKVLLASWSDTVPMIVYGVNHKDYPPTKTKVCATGSCRANAIAPILKVIEDSLGIVKGHIDIMGADGVSTGVDAVKPINNTPKAYGIIATSNTAEVLSSILPTLKGKLSSNTIHTPISQGYLAALHLTTNQKTSAKAVNTIVKKYALEGDLVEQITYALNSAPIPNDAIGTAAPCIYDSSATTVSKDGKSLTLYIWYHAEHGYAHQIIRLAKYLAQVGRYTYY